MKFLIYIPQLIFGGAEKVLVSFANDLVSRGHQVDVIELYERGLLKPQFDSRVRFDAICSTEYTEKYYASLAQIKANPSLKGKLAGSSSAIGNMPKSLPPSVTRTSITTSRSTILRPSRRHSCSTT